MDKLEVDALMELQYRFPLTPQPYLEVAQRIGVGFNTLKRLVEGLKRRGVIKRLGFNINYKASGKVAALVAARAPGVVKEELRLALLRDPEVTHNYVRDHETYNVWFVVKRRSVDELMKSVKEVAERAGVEDYLVLLGKRTYKLSVKFDLRRGVSWAPPDVLPERIPTFDELGLDKKPFSILSRWIPVEERPFKKIAVDHGFREEELVGILRELHEKRVIRNVGATLEGRLAGINHDGMVVFNTGEEECRTIAERVPEATHVVYRVPLNGEWRYPAYFMVHADDKRKIRAVADRVSRMLGGREYRVLYSLENLKPGMHSME